MVYIELLVVIHKGGDGGIGNLFLSFISLFFLLFFQSAVLLVRTASSASSALVVLPLHAVVRGSAMAMVTARERGRALVTTAILASRVPCAQPASSSPTTVLTRCDVIGALRRARRTAPVLVPGAARTVLMATKRRRVCALMSTSVAGRTRLVRTNSERTA